MFMPAQGVEKLHLAELTSIITRILSDVQCAHQRPFVTNLAAETQPCLYMCEGSSNRAASGAYAQGADQEAVFCDEAVALNADVLLGSTGVS